MVQIDFGKLWDKALELWRLVRVRAVVRVASLTVITGLGLMIPVVRDLLLTLAYMAANELLALAGQPPTQPPGHVPWWAGLILVLVGLVTLRLDAKKTVRVRKIVHKSGKVEINVEVETSDLRDADQIHRLLEQELKARADRFLQETHPPHRPPD